MKVSYSALKTWRRCHNLYRYKYLEGIRPKKPAKALFRGTLVHELLDSQFSGKSPRSIIRKYKKLDTDGEYAELIQDCYQIFQGYVEHYRNSPMKIYASEISMEVPLPSKKNQWTFAFIIDKIVEDKGGLWLLDHKTHRNLPGGEERLVDVQLVLYTWGWNQAHPDRPLMGRIWDYLRAKVPTPPELLKNGTLTRRVNLDSTEAVYLKAIKDHGLDPDEYQVELSRLREKSKDFYRRVYIPLPPDPLVEQVVKDASLTAAELGKDRVRSLTPDCKRCEFLDLCQAELNGQDGDFIRESYYTKREDADFGVNTDDIEVED